MGKNNNIIIINGKQYDAVTGDLMGGSAPQEAPAKKAPVSKDARHPAKHAIKHKTQSSKTLMRHAVRKPSDSLKRYTKAQSGNGAIAKHGTASVITKASVHKLDDKRLKHAQKVAKSSLITRFVPVSPGAGVHHRVSHEAKPHAKVIVAHHTPPVNPAKTTADLLQQALDQATSHQQTYTPNKGNGKTSSRITRMSVISVALLVIVGFATTQGISAVRLHVASSKAGFAVNTPDYKPAGYSLSQLSYSAGNADLLFDSNSDDRAFSINQKASSWDSNMLRDLVVAPEGNRFQTIESAGRTIFLDGNNNATWVSGGILYEVNSDGVLNEQQLIKIADSL